MGLYLLAAIGGALTGSESPVLFGDRGRPTALHPAEITKRDINGLRRFVLSELKAQNDDAWALAAGESVTACGIARPQPKGPPQSSVAKRLATGHVLSPAIGVRLSWCRLSARRMALFVNGESHVLGPAEAFAAAALCRPLSPSTARRMSARPKLIALVVRLLRHRVLDWAG